MTIFQIILPTGKQCKLKMKNDKIFFMKKFKYSNDALNSNIDLKSHFLKEIGNLNLLTSADQNSFVHTILIYQKSLLNPY